MVGGSRGGRAPMTRNTQVSKKLSWLLRHGAEKEGLQLGPGGYITVKEAVSRLSRGGRISLLLFRLASFRFQYHLEYH